jgi:hypothetical protein
VTSDFYPDDTIKVLRKSVCKKNIQKQVSDVLKKINLEYSYIHFVEMKPYHLSFVSIKYGRDLWLDIYIEKYHYMKQILNEDEYKNSEKFWNVNELMKEKVSKLRLRKKGEVLREYPKNPKLPIW